MDLEEIRSSTPFFFLLFPCAPSCTTVPRSLRKCCICSRDDIRARRQAVEAEYNMIRDPLFGLLAHVGLSADPDKRQVA